ncbi:MAG: type II toxin-antitoxin system prevent-host-death family antitoxin [Candidatus Pacebacteria bacterium]|nr:type II toxin-antitoxin system prevent-host-death family antitoxin [Candidatus Paceibacterota bacterium]
MKNTIVGLKELRENLETYISQVSGGKSFMIVRRSKPVFKIVPPESDDQWETVADFTNINKKGVIAKKVLRTLRMLNA